MSDWQPMTAAPKDGSHILLADFSRAGFGRINGEDVSWRAVAHWWGNPGEDGFYLSSGDQGMAITWATHWMPLPGATRPRRQGKDRAVTAVPLPPDTREAAERIVLMVGVYDLDEVHDVLVDTLVAFRQAALEEAAQALPATAIDPNVTEYERGYFDGVMAYVEVIRRLASPTPSTNAQPFDKSLGEPHG